MKKWIAGAVVAAGLSVFGGAAIAQDATPQDPRQTQDVQQGVDRSGDHEGCRFGHESPGGEEA
ncbi:hypothetical protein AVDCRST_MAG82-3673 [uncultured Rubrobacteraceae bacterium]|uniref:Uncharacterized protein n=1 Tax=uncultured Rubrobacteraceae bacterium TaxID=349277 RepID=A0A6J4QU49_9ACTN|nr:hypothetical protein AVDCRST_MAG82-3673 [uncultured Rubrobacteraceae bacterium]